MTHTHPMWSMRSGSGAWRIAVGCLVVIGTACAGGMSADSETKTTAADTRAPIPARVSEADVLEAVRTATTATELPEAITPAVLVPLANNGDAGWAIGGGCQPGREATSLPSLAPCTFGASDYTRTLMLIGDSHAAMWQPAFDLIGRRLGWRVIVLTKGNCGPADLEYYLREERRTFTECRQWRQWRLETIRRIKPAVVVTAGFSGDVQGPGKPTTAAIWQAAMERTVEAMPAGTRTVFLADQPHLSEFGPECLAKNPDNLLACADPVDEAVPVTFNEALEAAARRTGATYVDVIPWFCLEICPYAIADVSAYVGSGHVNKPYAARLSGVIEDAMRPVIDAVDQASGGGAANQNAAGDARSTTSASAGG